MSHGENTFDILFLIARPAAGKSEIIDYLKSVPSPDRAKVFHIGEFQEIDDFPMLWTWFEEDAILADMGCARLHTDNDGYFIGNHLWNLLIRRICLEYDKKIRDDPHYHQKFTSIIEFSRGWEHGGFREAFNQIAPGMLEKCAVLYIDVSYEESQRKNKRRFNPEKPDSILEHGLPEDKMEKLYRESDWEAFSAGDSDFLFIQEMKVPYVVFLNSDDATTRAGEVLHERLASVLSTLWEIYTKR